MLFNDFTRNHTTEQPNSPARSDGCSFTRESGEAEELYRSTLKKRREPWPKPGRRRTDREVFVMQKDTGFFRVPAKALFRASPDPLWAFPTEQPLELGDGDVWVVLDTLARILIDLLSKGRTPSRKLGFSAMFPPPPQPLQISNWLQPPRNPHLSTRTGAPKERLRDTRSPEILTSLNNLAVLLKAEGARRFF